MKEGITIAGAIIGTLMAIGLMRSCSFVPAGNVRVVDTFGSVKKEELTSGPHWFSVNPFSKRVKMDIQTQEMKEVLEVPTKEGLIAGLDISILYRIDPTRADEIYSEVGVDYADVIVNPMLRNIGRDVVANYGSEDLYNSNRSKISSDIDSILGNQFKERGVLLENVLLRDVRLPKEVVSAIEKKISEKQASEQMQYTLTKEKQQAEQKRIEARGIADAQDIIAKGLTQEYLTWKYINSLQELAKSPNTTFVITPYDQKLMPMLPLQSK